jgi:hypothetical protein
MNHRGPTPPALPGINERRRVAAGATPAAVRVMSNLAAIALLFLTGVMLRRLRWLEARHAAHLLRVVVNVGLPALVIGTLSRVRIDAALLVYLRSRPL